MDYHSKKSYIFFVATELELFYLVISLFSFKASISQPTSFESIRHPFHSIFDFLSLWVELEQAWRQAGEPGP